MSVLKKSLALLAAGILMMAALPASAAFPEKPVRLVLPWPAGGLADSVTRLVAERMAKSLGQNVVVENRAGANGMIGTEAVARSAPDGYTLVVGTIETMSLNPATYAKVPYDAAKDFEPVGMMVSVPLIISASTTSPSKLTSFKQLVSITKQSPGDVSYASWGDGSSPHLFMEMINQPAGLSMLQVPYKGTSPAMVDVLAGRVDLILVSYQTGQSHYKSERLRPLAVTGNKRLSVLPDVPTVAESGHPQFDAALWYSILAPAGTPSAVIERLNAAMRDAVNDTEFKARMQVSGAAVLGGTPADARGFIENDRAKALAISKSLGIAQKF
ncbi:MAG: tripartite tricarboxylate transporter substrate binding protein [Burkholderiales bacterium]|nr:tripartite tricarboxylate transporter substrate binding protein [Burkholderiales bacterium]